ncbi:hypothetical protein G6F62_002743 [Rhizopus arrhizus]|nr:hypothetical protein G6F23_002274 [Rhizopus arrhizus]KAG0950178.1 hypothetical protein G6F32_005273 [Rhizopus arrhizus]KAG1300167.1 hypothetical protein G6F66_000187 [Rhizopus arrhizus]KAG1352256.1 hypothetical protein G6F62_002743 [Rhizopus arrhizus]
MKRQATISSYFTPKKTKLEVPQQKNKIETKGLKEDKVLSAEDRKGLHEQFVERLGAVEQAKRQRRMEPVPQKHSPLELQVLELKARYPDCLLLIEVGYKFRFFGEDAKIASRVLHIANMVDRNFYVASIPVHRLSIHVQKLVNAGYKVGIVRQTETAALKAIGSNRNQPFERKLTQMLTKGTIVDEMYEPVMTHASGYLMCLIEERRGGNGPDDRVYTGMVAVQPSTGDIIYDTFEDTFMRNELETRLLHIEPSEILVPRVLSTPTEKLIKHLSTGEGAVRIEQMPLKDTLSVDYNAAVTFISEFYSKSEKAETLPAILELPDIVIKVLAALIRYLKEFDLSSMLHISKRISSFVSKSHMLMNANTLINLEVYRNNINNKEEGSLFSVLDHTRTKFGQRQLRKWVGRPLVDIEKLNERVDAINELLISSNPKKNKLLTLLKQLPDVEKGLCRIYYGRSSPAELVQVLDALLAVSNLFSTDVEPQFKSELLNRLFNALPSIHHDVSYYREMIDPTYASDKTKFFKSEAKWPDIPREKNNIKFVEGLLYDHLEELKTMTNLSNLKYVEVAGIEFLLEVENSKARLVPADWIKISGTKAVSRFHSRYIIQQLKEREQHKERLLLLTEKAFKDLLGEISEKYESFRDVVFCLAQLDCLLSLAATASQANYVRPHFTEERKIDVKQGRHPIIEKLTSYVSNDIQFSDSQTTMVLTGPNMGGKSSYIRQIALICMMGQIGSFVPAESATLCMLDAIYTRMGASDNMMRGESTFMVELHETSDIMRLATPRSLVILDELGRGTSTHDGQAIAYAVLQHFIQHVQSFTVFVTHYPSLSQLATQFSDKANNYYMDYIEEENNEGMYINYALQNGNLADTFV